MHQQAQTTGKKDHIDRKSIAKLEAGIFQDVIVWVKK